MPTDIETLRERLEAGCELAKQQGWTLRTGFTFESMHYPEYPENTIFCCPIGAATQEDDLEKAAELLGMRMGDAETFAYGFDGGQSEGDYSDPWYRMGREFRDKYRPAE